MPYKTVSVIARAVVDFSLVESPGKNVGYTDVGGDCPIFYMSNEMFVELYNNPAIMSYVFDVEKEHFLPATEFFQHHYNGHYKPATGICYIREHRNDEKTN